MSKQNMSKYIILPCSGIGKALGTIGRWAAYELADNLCPNTTRLLCLARFVVPDPDLLETLQIDPIITLDGCPKQCATKNVERNGCNVLKSYAIAKFIVQNRDLKIGSDIIDPGIEALELAKRIANFIAKDLDLLEGDK